MAKKKKQRIEYYILAGIEGMKKKLVESDLDLSPTCFMIVKEYSEIGKLIRKEARKRIARIR